MNCTQCGAIIRDHSGFCDQCGAKVEEMLKEIVEHQEENRVLEELDATTVINIKQELIQEAEDKLKREQTLKEVEAQRIDILKRQTELQKIENEKAKERDKYLEKTNAIKIASEENTTIRKKTDSGGRRSESKINSTLGVIKLLVKKPLLNIEELELYIDDTQTIKSIVLLAIISSIITVITFNVTIGRLVSGLIALFGNYFLLMGNSYMGTANSLELVEDILEMPFIQDSGFKVILYPLLSHLILISLISLFIIGIFRVIRKEDVTWIDCIRLMLTPLSILVISKVGVLLLSFISGILAAYFYVLMMFAIIIIMVIQFINFLGKSTLVIYTIPLIYLISVLIRNGIILQIIKISMARYALYF